MKFNVKNPQPKAGQPLAEKFKTGIIGAGVMGKIFVDRLLKTKALSKGQILVSKRYDDKSFLVNQCQVIILAVKPQDFKKLADQLTKAGIQSSTLIISIMAGVKIKTIQRLLNIKTVVRAIPNLPAKVGQGITLWKASAEVSKKYKDQTKKVLQSLGSEIEVNQEKMIDLATAVSGSGPAYVFLFQELMAKAAQGLGLSKELAMQLAQETIFGAVNLQRQLGADPKILKEQVTSKGGTTAAALQVFKKYQIEKIFTEALQAAFNRSKELQKI